MQSKYMLSRKTSYPPAVTVALLVCVCVCVCVRERERQRETERESFFLSAPLARKDRSRADVPEGKVMAVIKITTITKPAIAYIY